MSLFIGEDTVPSRNVHTGGFWEPKTGKELAAEVFENNRDLDDYIVFLRHISLQKRFNKDDPPREYGIYLKNIQGIKTHLAKLKARAGTFITDPIALERWWDQARGVTPTTPSNTATGINMVKL
jgi:hypothetical protein